MHQGQPELLATTSTTLLCWGRPSTKERFKKTIFASPLLHGLGSYLYHSAQSKRWWVQWVWIFCNKRALVSEFFKSTPAFLLLKPLNERCDMQNNECSQSVLDSVRGSLEQPSSNNGQQSPNFRLRWLKSHARDEEEMENNLSHTWVHDRLPRVWGSLT